MSLAVIWRDLGGVWFLSYPTLPRQPVPTMSSSALLDDIINRASSFKARLASMLCLVVIILVSTVTGVLF